MLQDITTYYNGYSPVGDLTVIGTCVCFLLLIRLSYIKNSKAFNIYKGIIFLLMIATSFRVGYYQGLNMLKSGSDVPFLVIKLLRFGFYSFIFTALFLFAVYMTEPLHIERRTSIHHISIVSIFYFLTLIYGVYEMVFGYQIKKEGANIHIEDHNDVYFFFYFIMLMWIVGVILYYRKRIFKQIVIGVLASCIISVLYIIAQYRHGNVSFTAVTFLFPMYTLLYMIHSNPYDIEFGTVDIKAFYNRVDECKKTNHGLILAEIYFPSFEKSTAEYPEDLRSDIMDLFNNYFNQIIVFQLSSGRMLLTADFYKNPDYNGKMGTFFEKFDELIKPLGITYKTVGLATRTVYAKANDYIGVFKFCGAKMSENSCHFITQEDEDEYFGRQKLLKNLDDITGSDLNDDRVLVYCQPVFNLRTQTYDTAEALMRLKALPDSKDFKVITPDRFIPLAEKYGYIYKLGLIMLNKVCRQIKKFIKEGYKIDRISVNFAVSDFRNDSFCEDVLSIIEKAEIPKECIAIEITETQNEKDFYILKDKMAKLKEHGIKFYLDDFGTGFSNYERIMELPFDVIKFDRSLVNSCSINAKSEIMVKTLAKMFSRMRLSVLYEGVETQQDIEKCCNMSGEYLQGFYYSKPLPIKEMDKFFTKGIKDNSEEDS